MGWMKVMDNWGSGLALATSVGQAGPPCGGSGDSGIAFWGSCWKRLFVAQRWACWCQWLYWRPVLLPGGLWQNFSALGKLSYKKNGKKRGHCPHGGEGGQPQFPFFSPNLPDPQITQKWTLDTTIWMLWLKVGLVRTPYTTQYLPVPHITFVWRLLEVFAQNWVPLWSPFLEFSGPLDILEQCNGRDFNNECFQSIVIVKNGWGEFWPALRK